MARVALIAAAAVSLLAGACGRSEGRMPAPHPTAASPVPLPGPGSLDAQTLRLGETVEFILDGSVNNDQWYCEIGDDPVPCQRFVVELPRAGTAVVRVEFSGNEPMFIQVGNLAVGLPLASATGMSPLAARAAVSAGQLPIRVGLHLPWGRRGYETRVQVTVSME